MINKLFKIVIPFIVINICFFYTYKPKTHATEQNLNIRKLHISKLNNYKTEDIFIKNKGNWIKPVDGLIPNPFGNSYQFYNMYRSGHTGIDITAKIGTPIYAVDNGIVKFIKTKRNMRYGNYLVIKHQNGLYTLYAHLQKINVKLNQQVKQGEIIANTGISGLASYPHLHFEVLDRVPLRDGAWGYNYICKRRTELEIKNSEIKRTIVSKDLFYDFLPLTTIKEKFAFENTNIKYIEHFYRMKNNICVEQPIKPVTYYNPEDFLPKYGKSEIPIFRGKFKSHNFVKPN